MAAYYRGRCVQFVAGDRRRDIAWGTGALFDTGARGCYDAPAYHDSASYNAAGGSAACAAAVGPPSQYTSAQHAANAERHSPGDDGTPNWDDAGRKPHDDTVPSYDWRRWNRFCDEWKRNRLHDQWKRNRLHD